MNFIDIVALSAVAQLILFSVLVARARDAHNVQVPLVVGPVAFERIYRVHQNTIEQLVALLPALYLAAKYWSPVLVASVGTVYLLGRFVYWRGYMAGSSLRTVGFAMTLLPTALLALAGIGGALLKA